MKPVRVRPYARRRTLAERRSAAKDVTLRYGPSRPSRPGRPFEFAPTPEILATMPKIRAEAGQEDDVLVPVPPDHPAGSFAQYEKQDAEALAEEIRKLKGEPVILTGGGGTGIRFMFLEDMRIVAFPPCLKEPDGRHCLEKPGWQNIKEGKWGPVAVWYQPDPDARPEDIRYQVQVLLRRFPGDKPGAFEAMKETFAPYIGSWRITALSGYGAERLRKDYPPGWE